MKLFKGKKKGMIFTRTIMFEDIWKVFFPNNFYEKYKYLGVIPYNTDKKYEMIHMLVLAMDAVAKPVWCPRWVLRFLHLFGSDNSIVRVRNRTLHNLEKKITKGMMMYDYKTKWADYDLRISLAAPMYLQDLADAIEQYTYEKGYKKELIERIKIYKPLFDKDWVSTSDLEQLIEKLEDENENKNE